MDRIIKPDVSREQRRRLERFAISDCVDMHCHCLPGVDDGPATMSQSIALCRSLVADGVTTAIATPHQLGRYHNQNEREHILSVVSALNEAVETEGLAIRITPGAEIRIDERIPQLLLEKNILTLADTGRYLLLELPNETHIQPPRILQDILSAGVSVILSHPERLGYFWENPSLVLPWLESGAFLQINAGSLIGNFGKSAQRVAWRWLANGMVSLVASDSHSPARPPCMSHAISFITVRLGTEVAREVCLENPLKVLQGRQINSLIHLTGDNAAN